MQVFSPSELGPRRKTLVSPKSMCRPQLTLRWSALESSACPLPGGWCCAAFRSGSSNVLPQVPVPALPLQACWLRRRSTNRVVTICWSLR